VRQPRKAFRPPCLFPNFPLLPPNRYRIDVRRTHAVPSIGRLHPSTQNKSWMMVKGAKRMKRNLHPCKSIQSGAFNTLHRLRRCPLTGRSLQDALRSFFQPIKTDDPRVDFYTMYKREAAEYDMDYVKKYDEDLNTTLIFVRPPPSALLNYLTCSCRPVCSLQSAPPSSSTSTPTSNPIRTSNPPPFSAPFFSLLTSPPSPVTLLPSRLFGEIHRARSSWSRA